MPNNAKTLCHRLFLPPSATRGSLSGTNWPYCSIQQVNGGLAATAAAFLLFTLTGTSQSELPGGAQSAAGFWSFTCRFLDASASADLRSSSSPQRRKSFSRSMLRVLWSDRRLMGGVVSNDWLIWECAAMPEGGYTHSRASRPVKSWALLLSTYAQKVGLGSHPFEAAAASSRRRENPHFHTLSPTM